MKCKSVHYAKKKYQSYPKVITNFYGCVVYDFLLTYRWVGLKPFRHLVMEFFDKGVGL